MRAFDSPDLPYFAGVAAANLARYEEAAEFLRDAASGTLFGDRAQRYLELIEKEKAPASLAGRWNYLAIQDWISEGMLARLKAGEQLRRYPGLVHAMTCLLEEDPKRGSRAIDALQELGTPEAVEVLRRVALGRFGTHDLRMHALCALSELEELEADEEIEIWDGSRWAKVTWRSMEISDEARHALPDELFERMSALVEALRAMDWERAEDLGRQMLAEAPDVPMVLHNLAQALWQQGKEEEAQALIERAFELDPSYLFAAAALIRIHLGSDRKEQAQAVSKSAVIPSPVHPDAYATFLGAQAELAFAQGDFEGAERLARLAEDAAPELDSVQQLREDLRFRLAREFACFAKRRRRRDERQLQRLLSPEPGLADCLRANTMEQLRDMARNLAIPRISALRKRMLCQRLANELADPGVVALALEALPPPARVALHALEQANGHMPFDEFTKRFGADPGGHSATLQPLREHGLVALGTIGGDQSVVLPREIRRALGSP
jgi:tetratricopeptide (TPR) repeat protein